MNITKWFLIRAFCIKKFFSDAKAKRILKKKAEDLGCDFPTDNEMILCIAKHSIITDSIVNF